MDNIEYLISLCYDAIVEFTLHVMLRVPNIMCASLGTLSHIFAYS
uniref:Uncharacterized protein n=1 Tax=Arundo donax TaxID=35708 RepID=A0A0A8ZZV4_ARUDO